MMIRHVSPVCPQAVPTDGNWGPVVSGLLPHTVCVLSGAGAGECRDRVKCPRRGAGGRCSGGVSLHGFCKSLTSMVSQSRIFSDVIEGSLQLTIIGIWNPPQDVGAPAQVVGVAPALSH